jgi:hypothetical protein
VSSLLHCAPFARFMCDGSFDDRFLLCDLDSTVRVVDADTGIL